MINNQDIPEKADKCFSPGSFPDPKEQKRYFYNILQEKLTDPAFRSIPGFPRGFNQEIMDLGNPPDYTACPNPWLSDFISFSGNSHSTSGYPHDSLPAVFASRARDPVYSFHPYHTKVPPDIIRELIQRYTLPKDIVLDPFAGSGMTGVAALSCGRKAILCELSPIAAFISSVNTTKIDIPAFEKTIRSLIAESKARLGWVYETREGEKKHEVNYYVWTDIFQCPYCMEEFPFFPHGVIHHGTKVETRKKFPCFFCRAELNVRKIRRVMTENGKKKKLVWVNAGKGKNKINRQAKDFDQYVFRLAEENLDHTRLWYPKDEIDTQGYSARLAQLGDKGITRISRFLSERNLLVFADLWSGMREMGDPSIKAGVRACLTAIFTVISERQGYFGGGGGMSGNLYMPIVRMEKNIYLCLERKIKRFIQAQKALPHSPSSCMVSTQSAADLTGIPDKSIHFIFMDPPFGANIIYSEMNQILESWIRVKTNRQAEAVINGAVKEGEDGYRVKMSKAFQECHRVLKTEGQMIFAFHNSSASVWNMVTNALWDAGFTVSHVSRLNKGSTTILEDIRSGAVLHDLLIFAHKQKEKAFPVCRQTDEKELWEIVETRLTAIPLPLSRSARIQAERTPRELFAHMVTQYVKNGIPVPLSFQDFHKKLKKRYKVIHGMVFPVEQVDSYACQTPAWKKQELD